MNNKEYKNNLYDWPEINFDEIWEYTIENKSVDLLYKGLIIIMFAPQIIIKAFTEILKLRI